MHNSRRLCIISIKAGKCDEVFQFPHFSSILPVNMIKASKMFKHCYILSTQVNLRLGEAKGIKGDSVRLGVAKIFAVAVEFV